MGPAMTARKQLHLLAELGIEVAGDEAIAEQLVRGGCRESSIERYMGPARSWLRYCADRGEVPYDASTAALLRWLDARVRASVSPKSAVRMGLAAVRFLQDGHCVVNGHEAVPYTPKARVQLAAWVGAATLDTRAKQRARPLRLAELAQVVEKVRRGIKVRRGVPWGRAVLLAERDAAMLLVGWWGALRGDDLARLEWSHLTFCVDGLELHMPGGKNHSEVADLALAARPECPSLCPVTAVRRYRQELAPSHAGRLLEGDEITSGRVFMLSTGDHVGRRIAALFRRCGVPRGHTAHSLRAGFATEAAEQGVPDKLVQAHGRWRTVQQHAEYVRLNHLWRDTPTVRLAVPSAAIAAAEQSRGDDRKVGGGELPELLLGG
jgi:integrase